MPIADKPMELSEQVLESVKSGQQPALEAVRKFAETVDKSLPLGGEGPSNGRRSSTPPSRWRIASYRRSTTSFLRSVVRSAGQALGAGASEKGEE